MTSKTVKNASKIWLRNGTKNNNTSSNMLVDHCYAFGLSLYPSGLKKKFLEGDPRDLFAPPWIHPVRIWPKTSTIVRDHEYFISTNFDQNPSSRSREEVENVKSLCRTDWRMDDGRRAVTIAHSSLWLGWAKKNVSSRFWMICYRSSRHIVWMTRFQGHWPLCQQIEKKNNLYRIKITWCYPVYD